MHHVTHMLHIQVASLLERFSDRLDVVSLTSHCWEHDHERESGLKVLLLRIRPSVTLGVLPSVEGHRTYHGAISGCVTIVRGEVANLVGIRIRTLTFA